MKPYLTRIELTALPLRKNVWLRFGNPDRREVVSPFREHVYFIPHSVLALVRWHGHEFGTTLWNLTVIRTVLPNETAMRLYEVTPGAEVLLRVSASRHIRETLGIIHQIEAVGFNPSEVNPDYWRCVHDRLMTRVLVPEYSPEEHAAYRSRVALVS